MKKSLLYTRTGDNGTTALASGGRVSKTHPRIEAYGTIDELNSAIGLLLSLPIPEEQECRRKLLRIQNRLFDLGAYLATDPAQLPAGVPAPQAPTDEHISQLEADIDTIDASLPPLHRFVIPGGTRPAAAAHLARTICRRAERRIIDLAQTADIHPQAIRYINRLSDFLFAFARFCNIALGADEIFWEKSC